MPKKRSDGRYSKQVTVGHKNGKPIRKTVYGKTQKELDKNYRELMLLVDRGVVLSDIGMTVTELRKQWYRIKKDGKIKRSTEIGYTTLMNRIDNSIGDMKVKDVTRFTIETFITEIQNLNLGCTARSILAMLYSIFDFAIDNDIVAKNPCKGLSVKYPKKEKRVLTSEEKDKINTVTCLSPAQHTFLLILRYTGMRRGEIFALTKADIDRKSLFIHVCKTVVDNNGNPYIQQSTKTDAGNRYVPILVPLAKVLFRYLDTLETDMLFPNKQGNIYASVSMVLLFRNIKRKVGLGEDLTMHCFRHNFISECYRAGVDVKKLQKWVGHTDIKTTLDIYTKLEKEDLENADEMNQYFSSQNAVKPRKREMI